MYHTRDIIQAHLVQCAFQTELWCTPAMTPCRRLEKDTVSILIKTWTLFLPIEINVWVKRIFSVSWVFSDLRKWSLGVCLSGHATDTMNSHLGWDAPNSIPRLQLELSFRDTEKALTLLPFFSLLLSLPPFSPTHTITRCLSPSHAFHGGLLPSHVNMNQLHFSFVLSCKTKSERLSINLCRVYTFEISLSEQ